jgi:hypothetical protein
MAKSASVVAGPSDTMRCASPALDLSWVLEQAMPAAIAATATARVPRLIGR